MTHGLFDDIRDRVELAPGALVLGGFVGSDEVELFAEIERIVAAAPFRRMLVPGGRRMSVAMTNCGSVGWVTDLSGYRYDPYDPATGHEWPPMPEVFARLAESAAASAGFQGFKPNACLVNRYEPGAKLSLHQDKDELDFESPIVSVSLGLPAVFLFGGVHRSETPQRIRLVHGDVVVFGGASRLRYHGVMPLAEGEHPLTGRSRINLTFRKTF